MKRGIIKGEERKGEDLSGLMYLKLRGAFPGGIDKGGRASESLRNVRKYDTAFKPSLTRSDGEFRWKRSSLPLSLPPSLSGTGGERVKSN